MKVSNAILALVGATQAALMIDNRVCGTWEEDFNVDGLIKRVIEIDSEDKLTGDQAAKVCTKMCNDYAEQGATCCMGIRYYSNNLWHLSCEAHAATTTSLLTENSYADYETSHGTRMYIIGTLENEGGGFTDSAQKMVASAFAMAAAVSFMV